MTTDHTRRLDVLFDFVPFEWLRRTTWVILQNQPFRSLLQLFSTKPFPYLTKQLYFNSNDTHSMHKWNSIKSYPERRYRSHTTTRCNDFVFRDDSGVWLGSSSIILHPCVCCCYPTSFPQMPKPDYVQLLHGTCRHRFFPQLEHFRGMTGIVAKELQIEAEHRARLRAVTSKNVHVYPCYCYIVCLCIRI